MLVRHSKRLKKAAFVIIHGRPVQAAHVHKKILAFSPAGNFIIEFGNSSPVASASHGTVTSLPTGFKASKVQVW